MSTTITAEWASPEAKERFERMHGLDENGRKKEIVPDGIEYIRGEMRVNKTTEIEVDRTLIEKMFGQCRNCTGESPVLVYKNSPDYPYCFDCTAERRPHLIDGRDGEAITAAFNELQKRKADAAAKRKIEFHKLHDQCQGSQCQNSDYPKYVHKDAPDNPYCPDCATDNAMIDRRDFEAVQSAMNDLRLKKLGVKT